LHKLNLAFIACPAEISSLLSYPARGQVLMFILPEMITIK